MPDTEPKTLIEAVRHFSDLTVCHAYMVALKWPDGRITCPKCGGDKVGNITSRCMLQCKTKGCRKQFSVKVGTIFEDSPLPLSSWFVAVWSIANAKNGISPCELGRALGVTQKSAWYMLHRIRLAMRTRTFRKLNGTVESDETYIGGKAENMHAEQRAKRITGRGGVGKAIVHGLLERGQDGKASQVNCEVITAADWDTLHSASRRTSSAAPPSAPTLPPRIPISRLDTSTNRWTMRRATCRGLVHVNGLENFWSLFKRALRGTYVAVAPFHLFRYVDAQAWRFNWRKLNDGERFAVVMSRSHRSASHVPRTVRNRRRRIHGDHMSDTPKERSGAGAGKAFDDLAKKLVQVPRKELEQQARRYEKRKKPRRKQ